MRFSIFAWVCVRGGWNWRTLFKIKTRISPAGFVVSEMPTVYSLKFTRKNTDKGLSECRRDARLTFALNMKLMCKIKNNTPNIAQAKYPRKTANFLFRTSSNLSNGAPSCMNSGTCFCQLNSYDFVMAAHLTCDTAGSHASRTISWTYAKYSWRRTQKYHFTKPNIREQNAAS